VSTVVYSRKQLTGDVGAEAARSLVAARAADPSKAVVVYAMDGAVEGAEAEVYADHGVPVFDSLGELCVAVGTLSGYTRFLERALDPAPEAAASTTGLPDGAALLAEAGIATPAERLCGDAAEAAAAAAEMGFPVVLKVADPRVQHKTEAGGVVLGLRSAAEVEEAFERIHESVTRYLQGSRPLAIAVQEQVEGGLEVIVGIEVDPELGPFVLVGLGGVLTELLRDTAVRPAPVSEQGAHEMLSELRGAALLRGHRGSPPVDVDAVAAAVSGLSLVGARHAAHLLELDVNPLVARPLGEGVRALDVLVVPRP
jgi:acetyltransferase